MTAPLPRPLRARRPTALLCGGLVFCLALLLAPSAQPETTRQGNLRITFTGAIKPHRLPRSGEAPIAVSLAGQIATTNRSAPPQLRRISIAINHYGRLDYQGLPLCRYHDIQPASTAEALHACRRSKVGTGTFAANVALPEQSPFPNDGRILAFNGILHHRHVIFAHIYGTTPLPQSSLLVFAITHSSGTYGLTLTAELPRVAADWGYVSGLSLNLSRRYRSHGTLHSYLSAGCPTPTGISGANFPLARGSFAFEEGRTVTSVLTRSCTARR